MVHDHTTSASKFLNFSAQHFVAVPLHAETLFERDQGLVTCTQFWRRKKIMLIFICNFSCGRNRVCSENMVGRGNVCPLTSLPCIFRFHLIKWLFNQDFHRHWSIHAIIPYTLGQHQFLHLPNLYFPYILTYSSNLDTSFFICNTGQYRPILQDWPR